MRAVIALLESSEMEYALRWPRETLKLELPSPLARPVDRGELYRWQKPHGNVVS